MGFRFGGAKVVGAGVASSMMLQKVVWRSRGAGGVIHSEAAVGQEPLQNAKGHLQIIGENPSSMGLALSVVAMLQELYRNNEGVGAGAVEWFVSWRRLSRGRKGKCSMWVATALEVPWLVDADILGNLGPGACKIQASSLSGVDASVVPR